MSNELIPAVPGGEFILYQTDDGRTKLPGLRILFDSDLSEERFEVVIVPASWLAFAARASRSPSVLLENHQRQLPEH